VWWYVSSEGLWCVLPEGKVWCVLPEGKGVYEVCLVHGVGAMWVWCGLLGVVP